MKISTLNIILAVVAILGLSSCNIKEDMSDCPGYILLDYTQYPDEVLEEIDPNEMVNIYIFDEEGICIDIISRSYGQLEAVSFQLTLPMEYNGKSLVVWQGTESEDYEITDMELGHSYDDFYLELETLADSSFESAPSSLWASEYQTIEYCAAITRHRIYMTRINTEVNVSLDLRGYDDGVLTWLDMRNFDLTISAVDDTYHTDYTLSGECERVEYNNIEQLERATDAFEWAHLGTLRLETDMRSRLRVYSSSGEELFVLDLVQYMLMTKTDSSMEDQRFLDLNKIWDITFILEESVPTPDPEPEPEPDPTPDPTPDPDDDTGYVLLGLTINGWTTWFDSVDLGSE